MNVPLCRTFRLASRLAGWARPLGSTLAAKGVIGRVGASVLGLILPLVLGLGFGAWGLGPSAQPAQAADPDGAALFQAHCAGCHVHGGNIIRRGRTLKLKALERQGLNNPEAIATVASQGLGQMGGYGKVLGAGGAEQVGLYVWQQALAGWPVK